MSRSRPHAVYVIGSQDGPQKIGITDNLSRRLAHLQVGRFSRLHVACHQIRPLGDARLVERAAHMLLSAKRGEGEWFNVSLREAIDAVGQAIAMVEAGEIAAPAPRAPQENVIGIRLDLAEREALERAAAADDRTMSALARRIIIKWLRANGYLKP